MWSVFCAHTLAVVASIAIVRLPAFEPMFSNRYLETLVLLPTMFSLFIFPVVMLIVVVVSRQSLGLRALAILGDLLLSKIQFIVWLPTFQ